MIISAWGSLRVARRWVTSAATHSGKSVVVGAEPERYVYLADGTCLNAEIIRQGYGFAYVKYPFSRMEEYRRLERTAREEGRGLWHQSEP
ncbi:MAG: hypothetical protein E2P01_00640 [Acidobacteria bacterium]|nr:MAG: hypothetical protein E2P01_00640 [Acidobacteriota bacterium]